MPSGVPCWPSTSEKGLIVNSFLIINEVFQIDSFVALKFPTATLFVLLHLIYSKWSVYHMLCQHNQPRSAHHQFQIRSLSNQLWLEQNKTKQKKDFSFPSISVGKNVSCTMLPICTLLSRLFLSTECKFSRKYMICTSVCVRKLLYKQLNVNSPVTFWCMWRHKETITL